MVSIHGIATKLGKCLSNLTEQPEAEEMYSYGLEIILGGLFKVFILVVLATLLGMLHLTIAVAMTSFLYRLLSGGAHCKAYNRCLVVSIASFLMLAYLAKLSLVLDIPPRSILFVILALALFIAVKYAPLAPDNKPIEGVKKFLCLKALSVGFIIVWFAVNSYLPVNVALASAYALMWQSVSLTPLGQIIFSILDGMLMKMFFWEGGEIL